MKRFNFPDDKEKPHYEVLQAVIPENKEDLNTFTVELAKKMASAAAHSKVPLAVLACALVDGDGFMPELIEKVAAKLDVPEHKLALAFLASFGKELFCAEIGLLRDKCQADGMEVPTMEWVKEHVAESSFARAAHNLEKLTCDCPACILFWSAKRFEQDWEPKDLVNEVIEVLKAGPTRYNEGCVKHQIPGAKDGKWIHKFHGPPGNN